MTTSNVLRCRGVKSFPPHGILNFSSKGQILTPHWNLWSDPLIQPHAWMSLEHQSVGDVFWDPERHPPIGLWQLLGDSRWARIDQTQDSAPKSFQHPALNHLALRFWPGDVEPQYVTMEAWRKAKSTSSMCLDPC